MSDGAGDRLTPFLRRDSAIVLVSLLTISGLAWFYLLTIGAGAPAMSSPPMQGMSMPMALSPAASAWTLSRFLLVFAMWAAMMIGMMTPSVAPTILLYASFRRSTAVRAAEFAPATWFVSGYLIAWVGFALLASLGQYALDRAMLLTPSMALASRTAGAAVLIAAGIYQWTPLKGACLASCRAPLSFVQRHGGFDPTVKGSIRLGLLHGLYCVGCCWVLMLLLFVTGAMNLLWVAVLTVVVLSEKVLPYGTYFARAFGVIAIASGVRMFVG